LVAGTDVSEHPVSTVFKSQAVQEEYSSQSALHLKIRQIGSPETSVNNSETTPHNMPSETTSCNISQKRRSQ